MFKAKELTDEQVKQIRESSEGQRKLSKTFGISPTRVKLLKEAPSLEEAIKIGKGVKDEKPPGTTKTGTKTVTGGEIPLIGVGGITPPVRMNWEGTEITFTEDMIKSYIFYKFLKEKLQLQSDFSSTTAQLFARTCVQVGGVAVIEDKAVKIVEVENGRIGRETNPTGEKPTEGEEQPETG